MPDYHLYDGWKELLLELRDTGKPFVFKQGLDVCLLDDDKAELLWQKSPSPIQPVSTNPPTVQPPTSPEPTQYTFAPPTSWFVIFLANRQQRKRAPTAFKAAQA